MTPPMRSVWLHRGEHGPSWLARDGQLVEASAPGDATRLDCEGDVALRPGAVNAHTHLYSGLAAFDMPSASPPPQDFLQILERVWWRLDRALDERSLRASARWAIAEALSAGTTALIDHHESPRFIEGSLDVLADAAEELGARIVVGYGATERNGGREEAKRGLAECARFLKSNRGPLATGLVALHASFTVSDETLREAGALARELGVGVHVHVAEDLADVEDARRRGYPGPLERLLALDALPPRSVVAHGVHLDEAQVRSVAEAGAWLVQNPRSNEGNGVGYPQALGASEHVALGTDGWPADMGVERDALRRLGRAHGEPDATLEARVAGGWDLFAAITGVRVGAIEPGRPADVVVGRPGAKPRHVLVAGRPVVVNGELVTADLEEIRARAREQAPRLWELMAQLGGPGCP